MEKYERREAHPMEKYIGRHVIYNWRTSEVVGYNTRTDALCGLIIDASDGEG